MTCTSLLPNTIEVIERGWLSSNQILFHEENADVGGAVLIDSGYVSQADQTLSLIESALNRNRKETAHGYRTGAQPRIHQLINTHSHADHVGGNAALQARFGCEIVIPAGIADTISEWNETALLLTSAGQRSARFSHDSCLNAGDEVTLGGLQWRALAAPGHDMHALMFHCPSAGILISGDALWQDGFGVVFNELMEPTTNSGGMRSGEGFAAARQTLQRIAELEIRLVIPGHGAPFTDVERALQCANSRLYLFEHDRKRLAIHAIKACFSFNLLDLGCLAITELDTYLAGIPFFQHVNASILGFDQVDLSKWLLDELLRQGRVTCEDGYIRPNDPSKKLLLAHSLRARTDLTV